MGRGIRRWSLLLILLLALGLRLRGITNPLLDDQAWRQADTASMATHMLGRLTDLPNVFFPLLNYDGVIPQRVELEFPFLPYLLAWTWTFFGWADIWGRLWSVVLSMLTIAGIYTLGRDLFTVRVGLFAAAIYALMPISIYYGRVVMPEPMAQTWSIWALVSIYKWRSTQEESGSWKAGLLMAGAILAKLPQLMLFPVALLLGFWPLKPKLVKPLIRYVVIVLILPMVYYLWVHYYSTPSSQFVSGILAGNMAESSNLDWKFLSDNIRQGLTDSILILAGGGMCRLLFFHTTAFTKARRQLEFLVSPVRMAVLAWVGVSALYVGIVCIRIPFDYYLVPILPLISLLSAYALDGIKDLRGRVLILVLIVVFNWDSYTYLSSKYDWDVDYIIQARWIKDNTPESSILVLSDSPPMTFYYANRVGFRLTTVQDYKISIRRLQQFSADYLIRLPHTQQNETFWRKIQESYSEIGPGIFYLKK
ncbi:Dolichyl-phosphate-mannose-protein mannosyltransferase [Desulfosporosinus sp. I2]|uniref:ArnT family glycosyltransferase n=1 Tax=Desulfosporosinus sp. I2 TaxID=1617025 RepID=UPI0005EEFDCB|nr:glycosyltransferase family 39 protein [Desulfosporosinus sp. I2]KJR47596.1 Dolichyl-phosphate-mannose-protein mannosyltransferase [Desulfosporosinus sp. I2]